MKKPARGGLVGRSRRWTHGLAMNRSSGEDVGQTFSHGRSAVDRIADAAERQAVGKDRHAALGQHAGMTGRQVAMDVTGIALAVGGDTADEYVRAGSDGRARWKGSVPGAPIAQAGDGGHGNVLPAGAGNGRRPAANSARASVHPRVRGEIIS
ncbi:hypothetical protein V2S84_17905, partial [Azotobacter chroococcum]|nr:hypothetical protein [Azotobacter chroococcum]